MKGIYSRGRYLGKQGKLGERKGIGRRVQEKVQRRGWRTKEIGARRRKEGIQSGIIKGVYGKIDIWIGKKEV